MTLLYLVRHGETDLNTKGVYYGWTDDGLSPQGIKQAEKMAVMLEDVHFDTVISSPLTRARETAVIVSRSDPDRIILDERLKELNFGAWEGKHYQVIQDHDKENWDLWVKDWKKASPPAGESFVSMYRRVKQSIKETLEKYEGQTLLMVTHQGCLRIIMCILLNMKYEGYWHFTFDHGAYSLIDVEQGYCIVKKINQKP
ncbi:alpha-ribazole phosphatase [Candidatus Formimonas warabiya]|uniref:Alpha-ribazole phosphatase n=1 Tax=Formimonas warabiya TaxID=1761012 RepID=A0A3G1L0C9_FORW1|nr:alpha-ribazole phosphatase [Candidatus Formimonas warabiya]ATW28120.1 alpha-ribazole phosphatase [Candidatus Formimonas warabiya]